MITGNVLLQVTLLDTFVTKGTNYGGTDQSVGFSFSFLSCFSHQSKVVTRLLSKKDKMTLIRFFRRAQLSPDFPLQQQK